MSEKSSMQRREAQMIPVPSPDVALLVQQDLAREMVANGVEAAVATAVALMAGAVSFALDTGGEAMVKRAIAQICSAVSIADQFARVDRDGVRQ